MIIMIRIKTSRFWMKRDAFIYWVIIASVLLIGQDDAQTDREVLFLRNQHDDG